MDKRLLNTKTVVTGGSRGIGAGIVKRLFNEGSDIIIADILEDEANDLINSLKAKDRIFFHRTNLAEENQILDLFKFVKSKWGALNFLINNAGYTRVEKFISSTPEEWDKQIDVCLKGSINCCHLVIENMIENQYGRIINIVGDSSRIGEANLAVTAAARGGTIALSKSLAKELGRYNITVNTISLGLVKTTHSNNNFLEKNMEKILKFYPLKRIGKADDVAPMVSFLCSNNASWITGQVISINGGFCMV